MKNTRGFITALQTEAIGFGLVLAIWAVAALFYPAYIIPSPVTVLTSSGSYLPDDFPHHVVVTLYRVFTGFALSLFIGTGVGLLAFGKKWNDPVNSVMLALQVLPGTVIGVIFLLMFGIGNTAPILLITALVLPTITVNTINGLAKRNQALEQYLQSIRSNRSTIIKNIYLPALVPIFQSNLSLGIGLATKVVVLGEFIGAQDGLGYLLNRAQITFNMKEVFFYLVILLLFTLVFQACQSMCFSVFLKKYFYSE
jgi:ABC-type nitrate/sulfonate/bicarbonate transport system permease component